MKFIATTETTQKTENDFVKAEVEEWGYDYVEAQFENGYEPTLVSGVWCWRKKAFTSSNTSCHIASNRLASVSSLIR